MIQTIDVALHGVGNVGRRLLELIVRQAPLLVTRHALRLRVIAAVDSGGLLYNSEGLEPETLIHAKKAGRSVATLAGGTPHATIQNLFEQHQGPTILLESTLVNLKDGEPGLSAMRVALQKGWSVVSANKGPLVLALPELSELAGADPHAPFLPTPRLAYSATVCGGLPVVNMGRRDLSHCTITTLEGIFNSTTNYILSEMEQGRSYADALAHAQAEGIAETDPQLDVSGWDAANKLIIIANSVLGVRTTKNNLSVTGIEGVDGITIGTTRTGNRRLKLVARALRLPDGTYELSVAPIALPLDHPLARLDGHAMGILIQTDINGQIFASIDERDPTPTAAAMIRDIITLVSS